MKKIYSLSLAVLIMAAFSACNSVDLQPEEPVVSQTEAEEVSPVEWTVSIQASKGGGTKALSESGNTITASWEAGDVVYICNSSYDFGTMTAQSSGSTTKLIGTVTRTMKVGSTYTLRYLQKGQDNLYLPSQKGTLADIAKNHDVAEATVTVKSVDGNEVVFNEESVQFQSKISITKFTFSQSIVDLSIFSTNLKTFVRPGYSGNYCFIQVQPDAETTTVYAAMSTLEDSKAVYSFLAKGADGHYYVAYKNATLANGKNYKVDVTLSPMPEYEDLGITRDGHSVCWRTMNLGASGPGDPGNYYAWGETSPKSTYSWDNYPYGSYSWITKYDPDRPDQGVVDGLATLLPEDDAAVANLIGSGWRMPGKNDFSDLLNSSEIIDYKNVYADGMWGYVFISKKEGFVGKFVFIPCTNGYFKDGALTNKSYSYYWSSSIDQQSWTSASFANTLYFSSPRTNYPIYPEVSRMDRAYGLCIRPVYVK